ncbi:hypothetical protein N9831_02025 [Amylibacter sp.]|nr:hypothetical protein [Amylibacter sp.]
MKPKRYLRKLWQELIDKTNPRRTFTVEEQRRLTKLEAIADKLKRGENVQNHQMQSWLSKDNYTQIDAKWQEQLEPRKELKDKSSDLKRYEEEFRRHHSTTREGYR